MSNRLAGESSPYLRQHKDNPVDWYPWGAEAFSKARAEDKPMFVSIGYAACHWCHVMERESFEDPEIAARMNELFVNVKVDREERPDVDSIYINAIHVMGERGGWPLSAFCDSDGRPFYVGTYFPPGDRYGRPGFARVLDALARAYREERDKLDQNARAVLDGLRQIDEIGRRGGASGDPGALSANMIEEAGRALAQKADPEWGGLGKAPKFPSPSAHDLLARAGRLESGAPCREAFLRQARAMARGGIYDHLGGGFSRYSVDERWLVPHFEKMLYDNGQLLEIYGDAFAMSGDGRFAEVVAETVGWLEREMSEPDSGGLYASLDADSEGEEGKYYVWTPKEVEDALGPADAIQFSSAYGVTSAGNFEGQTSVLSRVREPESDGEARALADMRRRLLAAREARIRPATDDKILAGWNGLALSGLVRAWEATGHEPARSLALRVAEFLAREMVRGEGEGLWRVYKEGERKLEGTLEDYAYVARGLLSVAQAGGEARYFELGRALTARMVERFYAVIDGVPVFYMTSGEDAADLVHRPESFGDGALPAGAAVAVECLLRVGRLSGDDEALAVAERYLAARAPLAAEQPVMASRLLSALDLYLHGTEVVVAPGDGEAALWGAVRRAYAPTALLAGDFASEEIWRGKSAGERGEARAYVCRGTSCSPPTSDPAALARLVAARE